MPPRRTSQRSRVQRQSTQFGQLETTPTSHHFQAPENNAFNDALVQSKKNEDDPHLSDQHQLNQATAEDYSQSLDDQAFLDFSETHIIGISEAKGFNEGTLTRRSSPLNGHTPNHIWDFEHDSLPAMSSPRSGTGKLPDTFPIAESQILEPEPDLFQAGQAIGRVDLSETASTARRSSPYGNQTNEALWDFATTPGGVISHIDDDLVATPHGDLGDMSTTLAPLHFSPDELHVTVLPRRSVHGKESPSVSKSPTLLEIADSFDELGPGLPDISNLTAPNPINRLESSTDESVSSPPDLART